MPVDFVSVVYWTVGGLLVGMCIGWFARMQYEARNAALAVAAEAHQIKEALSMDQKWDGENRRYSVSEGHSSIAMLVVVFLFIASMSVSVVGTVTTVRAGNQAECYTEINEDYSAAIEARVKAVDLTAQAAQFDRDALDILVRSILTDRDQPPPPPDVRVRLREYQAAREKSEILRERASVIRENNQYPTAARCRK